MMNGRASSQRRKPYTRESIAHALAHHESRGVLRGFSEPSRDRPSWRITTSLGAGAVFECTSPQAYAFCVALAAAETHARVEHERFVHDLAAYAAASDPPCLDDASPTICPKCDDDEFTPQGCRNPWCENWRFGEEFDRATEVSP